MEVCKLTPAIKDYVWGGKEFIKWGKSNDFDRISECWELSFHKDGLTTVNGKPLKDLVTKEDLGTFVAPFKFFPVLIKLINSEQDLSIQVHPSDEYALKNENSYGKTEMWYILDAKKGSGLYLGFKKDVTKDEFKNAINNKTLTSLMNFVEVKKGDCYFIESGTIHAIGKGITLVEIQQNSNLTYRVYDYGRLVNGKERELHIDKALEVTNLNKFVKKEFNDCLGKCEYFATYLKDDAVINTDKTSFISITFIEGEGKVNDMDYKVGDTFFIPATKKAIITGKPKYLLTKVINNA